MKSGNICKFGELTCPFCGSKKTILSGREGNKNLNFRCWDCESSFFVLWPSYKIEKMMETERIVAKYLGDNYKELLSNSHIDKGAIRCPYCQKKIEKIKPTKTGKFLYWSCADCFSKGYVYPGMIEKWKVISGIIDIEEILKK